MELGVDLVLAHNLRSLADGEAVLGCSYTGRIRKLSVDAVVMVTARSPNQTLYQQLARRLSDNTAGTLKSVHRIGDCEAPAIIASAVYAGHRFAQEFDAADPGSHAVKRDRVEA